MHLFYREIADFVLANLKPGQSIKTEDRERVLWISSKGEVNPICFVLHFLDERPEDHLKKMEDYVSGETRRVIHLWEDHWRFSQNKVMSRLLSLLGGSIRIHGRQTLVRRINNDDLLDFLTKNHLNVPLKGKYKYGLMLGAEPVAVMSFSKARPIERKGHVFQSFELLRFCNKLNHTVIGGFSKLLDHFIKNESPDDIMTYVDKDWSDGAVYSRAGFVLEGQLPPMEFFLNSKTGARRYPDKKGDRPDSDEIPVFNSGSYKFIRYLK